MSTIHTTFSLNTKTLVCFLYSFIILFATTVYSTTNPTHPITSPPKPDKSYKRIISLYSGHTENLCSLGAADQIIGITMHDNYPQEITSRQRFSYREDPEKFINAKPDLVLIRPMIERGYPEFITKLRLGGIKVISLQPNSIDEMFSYWKELGALAGKQREAKEMINSFSEKLENIQSLLVDQPKNKRPKVYFESIHTKMRTVAPNSIAAFVLEQAGGINIASDAIQVRKTNIGYYSKEKLIVKGEKVDHYIAQKGRMNPVTLDIIYNEPGYDAIKAVRNKKVFLVDEALVSRPTYRLLEGIEMLYRIFFPEQLIGT